MDYLIERMWNELDLVKVYTKKRGAHPDLSDPICLRKGASVEVCCVLALRLRDSKWAYLMARRASATVFIGLWRLTSGTL